MVQDGIVCAESTPQGMEMLKVPEMAEGRLDTVLRFKDPFGSSVIRSQVTDQPGIWHRDGGFLVARRSAGSAGGLPASRLADALVPETVGIQRQGGEAMATLHHTAFTTRSRRASLKQE